MHPLRKLPTRHFAVTEDLSAKMPFILLPDRAMSW